MRPSSPPRVRRSDQRGFALVIVLAGITVMLILMGAATPTWRYLMKDDREQELFFRGDQIARGVEAFQRKNGNTFPPSLEVLVKGKYLRRAYKDPMVKDGKWRLVRPGEAVPVSAAPAGEAARARGRARPPRRRPRSDRSAASGPLRAWPAEARTRA